MITTKLELQSFDSFRDGGTALVHAIRVAFIDNDLKPFHTEHIIYYVHGCNYANNRTDVTVFVKTNTTCSDDWMFKASLPVDSVEVMCLLQAVLDYNPKRDYDKVVFNSYAYHHNLVRALIIATGIVNNTKSYPET